MSKRTAKKSVEALLDEVAREVATLPLGVIRDLLPALNTAQREVEVALRNWLRSAKGSSQFTAHQYRSLILQLRTAQEAGQAIVRRTPRWVLRLRDRTSDVLQTGARTAGKTARRHLVNEVATLSEVFGGPGVPTNLRQAGILAHGKQVLTPRFESSARRYSGGVWDDIRRQLAVGVSKGETVDQLVHRLRRLGGPKTPDAPAGLFRRYGYWAERLVRTEIIHAYSVQHAEGIRQLHKEDGGYRQRWDARIDSSLCIICYGLHGETVEVGQDFSGGFRYPPAHPNCRCALVAWHEQWGDVGLP